MRVIAGIAKGTRLVAPKGLDVRPTLDRVREALFSILAPRLEGARFLDLFAGSGANGVEALSRGAAAAVFADSDDCSLQAIRRNLEATHLATRARVARLALPEGLSTLAVREQPFDIVFADPPYDFSKYADLLGSIRGESLLAADGVLVIEHATRVDLGADWGGFARGSCRPYGDTALSFFS